MPDSEKKREWMKANTVLVAVKLNKRTDADIIAAIGNPASKAARVKELIRAGLKAK